MTEALRLAGLPTTLPPDACERALPTFEKVFQATDGELLAVATPALAQLTGEALVTAQKKFLTSIKRLMIFDDIEAVKNVMRPMFHRIIEDLPRSLAQLEVSGGGRDVLDPFIVAFDSRLLSGGSVEDMLRNLFAHKCLMKMEDMIGHLHEEVVGRAGGKVRVPEPVAGEPGRNKEDWHATYNPYPGADARLGTEEFYQIKNKTGSAKGSDGEKLGRQFKQLGEKYPGSKRYYVSLIGKTLAGHRSMGAFLRTDPEAVVLVGLAAWQQLGGHRDTPLVVMDLYIEVFEEVSEDMNFDFEEILQQMVTDWRQKHGDKDPAREILRDTIVPSDPRHQSSETYGRRAQANNNSSASTSEEDSDLF